MKKMKYIRYILVLFIVAGINPSCELLEENPEDRLVVGNFYQSESDAVAAVNSIYSRLYGGMYERQFSLLADLATDDLKNGIGMANSHLQDIEYSRHTSENEFVRRAWVHLYEGIARANTAIRGLDGIPMDETLKRRLIGEAKFLRALFYFNAVRFWGDIPLIIKIESLDDAYAPRSPKADVYDQIIEDLEFAAENLPTSYGADDIGRATMGAAKILLGKVYLTLENWSASSAILADVISVEGTFGYGLHDNYRDNWEIATENVKEMVFSVQFLEPPGNGNQLMQAIGPKYSIVGGVPGLTQVWESDLPSIELYNSFDDADERKTASFNWDYISPSDGLTYTSSIPLFYKYFEIGESLASASDNNFHVLRYSDALLMYAEALNEQGSTTEAEPYINRVRERAFNDSDHNYSGLSQSELRDSIRLERRLEFTHEGHRFFDLVRWEIYVSTMQAHGQLEATLAEPQKTEITANVSETFTLFPIPQHEIDLNPDLGQNPGY